MALVHLLAWFPMILIAIANGVARDLGYGKYTSELRAHQISTLTAALLFTLYAWALSHLWPLATAFQALAVGGAWLILTIAFEVLFGHYVAKHSWERLAADYAIWRGRVWSLLLLWLSVLPYVCFRLG